ncbi:hypothetical protein HK405_010314, partial [Cladochytrium tenue]
PLSPATAGAAPPRSAPPNPSHRLAASQPRRHRHFSGAFSIGPPSSPASRRQSPTACTRTASVTSPLSTWPSLSWSCLISRTPVC